VVSFLDEVEHGFYQVLGAAGATQGDGTEGAGDLGWTHAGLG